MEKAFQKLKQHESKLSLSKQAAITGEPEVFPPEALGSDRITRQGHEPFNQMRVKLRWHAWGTFSNNTHAAFRKHRVGNDNEGMAKHSRHTPQ
ncbi:MAG: hypothetical protein KDA69_02885 [Planctomycetaceae bacterium]|nr:hypothetical protein [Planctomycetaceae bacterium]